MSINSIGASGAQAVSNPVKCQMKNGTVTFTYDDGSQTSVTCKDGKFTKSGSVKPGNIGVYTGVEITKDEAMKWFKEETSKLPGSKLNVQG